MKISIDGKDEWNTNVLAVCDHDDEHFMVSVHDCDDADPASGTTVLIKRQDLIRALNAVETIERFREISF